MKLTNIGGATAILEHRGKRMLFDPWLNEGIFYGSWYHFPPLKMGIPEIGRLDYIYISHIHEDHCAAGTLEHLNRDAEIIVMHREPRVRNYVLSFLKKYRFNFKKVHLIPPYTPTDLGEGLSVDMVEGPRDHEYSYWIDSALVLRWDGFVLYNANDCPPSAEGLAYIKKTYGSPDLALLSYACGSGYPNCYLNLSHEEKMKEKKRIHALGMKRFLDAVKGLSPRTVMPFADQYVIGGSRASLNQYSAHPPCPGAVGEPMKKEGWGDRLLLLNSAQSYDFDTRKKSPDAPYQTYTEEDRDRYVRALIKDKPYDHEKLTLADSVPLERLFQTARRRLWEFQGKENFFPDYRLCFDIPDRERRFIISLNKQGFEDVSLSTPPAKPSLRVIASSTLMTFMLVGHISWNMADGAFFFDYDRVPNVYDPKIYAMINLLTV